MTIQTILALILIGLAAGALSGLVGVGGGIVIVPALVYLLHFSQKDAQGTSLGILLLPVGILAVMQYYKQGHVDVRVVVIVSLAFIVGGLFGSKLALTLNEVNVKRIFAIFMLVMAIKMLFFDKKKVETKATIVTEKIQPSKDS